MIHRIGWLSGVVMSLVVTASGTAGAVAASDTYDSDVSARYRPRAERFVGTVSSEMPEAEVERFGGDCVNDREVSLFRRRTDGSLRLVGRSVTTEGRWRIEHAARRSNYVVKVAASELTYAPEYGEMEVARCEAASVSLKVTADQVLGIRIDKDGSRAGLLPVTGPASGLLAMIGVATILGGVTLSRAASSVATLRSARSERPRS